MSAMAGEVRGRVSQGLLSPEQAAEQVRTLRNEIMDLARTNELTDWTLLRDEAQVAGQNDGMVAR